jgi:hypothetical protein
VSILRRVLARATALLRMLADVVQLARRLVGWLVQLPALLTVYRVLVEPVWCKLSPFGLPAVRYTSPPKSPFISIPFQAGPILARPSYFLFTCIGKERY